MLQWLLIPSIGRKRNLGAGSITKRASAERLVCLCTCVSIVTLHTPWWWGINLCSRASKDRWSKCPTWCTHLFGSIHRVAICVAVKGTLKIKTIPPKPRNGEIHILELQRFRESDYAHIHLTLPQRITYAERIITYKIWITRCKWDTKGKIDKWAVVTTITVPANCCTFSAEATTVGGSSLSYGPP